MDNVGSLEWRMIELKKWYTNLALIAKSPHSSESIRGIRSSSLVYCVLSIIDVRPFNRRTLYFPPGICTYLPPPFSVHWPSYRQVERQVQIVCIVRISDDISYYIKFWRDARTEILWKESRANGEVNFPHPFFTLAPL